MNKVVLNKEEARWFSRNVIKTKTILEAAAKKDPAILERNTYRTLLSLQGQAKEIEGVLTALAEEPYEVELMLERKQKVVIRELIESTIQQLEEKVLPVYESRGQQSYIEDTKTKLLLTKAMVRKLK